MSHKEEFLTKTEFYTLNKKREAELDELRVQLKQMQDSRTQTMALGSGFPKIEPVHGNPDNHAPFPVTESGDTETIQNPSQNDNTSIPDDYSLKNETVPPAESGHIIVMTSTSKDDCEQRASTKAVINLNDDDDSVETFQPAGKKSTKK